MRPLTRKLLLAAGLAAACRSGPHTTTLASTWQMIGSTVSVAAWSSDSTVLSTAIGRMRDSSLSFDSAALPHTVLEAWRAERGELPQRPEWRDVADSYVLDRSVGVLAAAADSALIDLGGLFLWVGPATKRLVGIADPGNALDAVAHVELQSGAISTVSGRAEHRAMTVLAPTAFKASAWASALYAVGCERALALAARRGVSVVCADSAGVRWSPELQNRVALPTGRGP